MSLSDRLSLDCVAYHEGELLTRVPGTWYDAMVFLQDRWDREGDKAKSDEKGRWCWLMVSCTGDTYACSGSNGKQADTIIRMKC